MISGDAPVGSIAVLDIETEFDPSSMAPYSRVKPNPTVHQRIVGYSMLRAREDAEGNWTDFELDTPGRGGELEMIFDIDQSLWRAQDTNSTLITFNGAGHDLDVIERRRTKHWQFTLTSLRAMRKMPHRDLFLEAIRDRHGAWPSLRDLCGAWGIPADHTVVPRVGDAKPAQFRKSQVDVCATFLLYAHNIAAERGSAKPLIKAWIGLADFVGEPFVRQAHLEQFRNPRDVNRCRDKLAEMLEVEAFLAKGGLLGQRKPLH